MSDNERGVVLIGSMPFDDEEACMRRALALVGPYLRALPDGEVGDKTPAFPKGNRIAWVMSAIESLTEDRESWRMVCEPRRGDDGMAVDYNAIQKLKPRRPPSEMAAHVSFGYDKYALRSLPIFRRLRAAAGRPELKFQLGVPTGFALGFAFASKIDWLRYTGAMSTVIAREVNNVLAQANDDIVVQVELPPEVYAAHLLPSPLMGLALKPVWDFLGKLKRARIGVHLCLGDYRNEAIVHPKTPARLVALSNRLAEGWPQRHVLDYVHYPLAEGSVPPSLDVKRYAALGAARLPAGTRFVAGFVHEGRSLDESRRILGAIEDARGAKVDVASSCGLGRRAPSVAERLMEMSAKLAAA